MKIETTELEGVLVIIPDFFSDERGYFFESYNRKKFEDHGLNMNFVQDNISKSGKGTIRGLHYQTGENAQGKLCQVISGSVLDVAVDIRFGSPSFGKHFAVELNMENHRQVWIPPGFAHGFSVLSDEAVFLYKCTALYSKADERSIFYKDSDLNIDWKVKNEIVSEKDMLSIKFSDIEKDFVYNPG
ncbi:MAG: dTDP-4-dehydrorhamnose 3,5-epimerase [Ignavibacteria bacterium]|nr:dTDP-4-dehydrorhamnose 3,5-epimerase [Ignavibacteria bacterium]